MPPRASTSAALARHKTEITKLATLSLGLRTHRVPHTPENISLIFPHLSRANIPRRSTRSSPYPRVSPESQAVWLAVSSLEIITSCMSSLSGKGNPQLERRLAKPDASPNVWRWITFLHEECVLKKSYEDYICDCVPVTTPQVIQTLAYSLVLRKAMTQTPGVLEFVTKQWLLAEGQPEDEEAKEDGLRYPWAGAMDQLTHFEERADDVTKTVLEAAGGNPAELAKVALGRLRATLEEKPLDKDFLLQSLNLVMHLSGTNGLERGSEVRCPEHQSKLLYTFLLEGKLPVLIKVLTWCNRQSTTNAGLSDPVTRIVGFCTFNILDDLNSLDDSFWVIQLIENGLLPALLRSSKWVKGINAAGMLHEPLAATILSKILPLHLIFPKAVKCMRKGLAQVDRLGLGTKQAAGMLYEPLMVLKGVSEERSRLLDAWKTDEKFKHMSFPEDSCNSCFWSPEDDKEDDRRPLKRCRACMNVFYCSQKCQKLDWPEYKEICKSRREDIECGRKVAIEKSERSFLEYLVHDYIHTHKDELLKKVKPGLTMTDYFVRISFARVPVTHAIHHHSSGGSLHKEYEDDSDDDAESWLASPEEHSDCSDDSFHERMYSNIMRKLKMTDESPSTKKEVVDDDGDSDWVSDDGEGDDSDPDWSSINSDEEDHILEVEFAIPFGYYDDSGLFTDVDISSWESSGRSDAEGGECQQTVPVSS